MEAVAQRGKSSVDDFFEISARGSTVWREIRGGVVTFFTMGYIIALNPLILGFAQDADGKYLGGGDAPNLAAIAAGTALVAGVMTIIMGVYANFPIALATGLGLNAFVAFGIASQMTWADAMGLVVLEGIIILVLVLLGFRRAVFRAFPSGLKTGISVAIGLFLTLIALVDTSVVTRIPDAANTTVPVQLGLNGTLDGWPVLLFVVALLLAIALRAWKVKGAIFITILLATVAAIVIESQFKLGSKVDNPLGWTLNVPAAPESIVGIPVFGTLLQFNLLGSFGRIGLISAALLLFTLVLADFFDTVGTVTAVASEAKMTHEDGSETTLLGEDGSPPRTQRILIVDSVAAAAGGVAGVSSNTSYIESTAGVAEGARTGLASVVTGVLFLLSIFFAPVVNLIPSEAAMPALVVVGFLMMTQVADIDWKDAEIGIPAFLTMVLMPFTYSISVGIGAGIVAYVFIKLIRGKVKQVRPLLWVVAGLFVIYFAINPVSALLTR